jgi:hypothetical protein
VGATRKNGHTSSRISADTATSLGLDRGAAARIGLVCLAAAFAVLARGGFPDAARALFALLAGLALLACLLTSREAAARVARSPIPLVLGALALLAIVSAAWTVARPEDAIRYGLVIAGYAGLAVAGGVVAVERRGRIAIYVLIAALAALTGVVGLVGAGIQDPPYGQRIGGSWQPAGTFEYAPTTALL